MIIGGVISSLAVFNGFYPAITTSTNAISNTSVKVSDRIESRIEIIQVGNNGNDILIWVKNIGTSEVVAVDYTDVFFGPTDDFYRVSYNSGVAPWWEYELEGGKSRWTTSVTAKLTLHPAEALSAGTYLIKVVLPNGIYDELFYTVD